jgi:hypothetical protein
MVMSRAEGISYDQSRVQLPNGGGGKGFQRIRSPDAT